MAKVIKYNLCTRVNHGTEETPEWEDILYPVEIHCTADKLEANLVIARAESYNGVEPEVTDDGIEEVAEPTPEERIAALEAENTMLMECLLEMSEIVYA